MGEKSFHTCNTVNNNSSFLNEGVALSWKKKTIPKKSRNRHFLKTNGSCAFVHLAKYVTPSANRPDKSPMDPTHIHRDTLGSRTRSYWPISLLNSGRLNATLVAHIPFTISKFYASFCYHLPELHFKKLELPKRQRPCMTSETQRHEMPDGHGLHKNMPTHLDRWLWYKQNGEHKVWSLKVWTILSLLVLFK